MSGKKKKRVVRADETLDTSVGPRQFFDKMINPGPNEDQRHHGMV
jgi:hypothetical protein